MCPNQVLAHPEKLWVHKSNMHRGIKVKNLKGMLSPCTALVSQWSTVSVPLPGKDIIFFNQCPSLGNLQPNQPIKDL